MVQCLAKMPMYEIGLVWKSFLGTAAEASVVAVLGIGHEHVLPPRVALEMEVRAVIVIVTVVAVGIALADPRDNGPRTLIVIASSDPASLSDRSVEAPVHPIDKVA